MITKAEVDIVIRNLQEDLNSILKLTEDEENEILKESLKAEAIAVQKGIAIMKAIGN